MTEWILWLGGSMCGLMLGFILGFESCKKIFVDTAWKLLVEKHKEIKKQEGRKR